MGNEAELIACYEALRRAFDAVESLAGDLDTELVRIEPYLPKGYGYSGDADESP